jgi:hypothetical protein
MRSYGKEEGGWTSTDAVVEYTWLSDDEHGERGSEPKRRSYKRDVQWIVMEGNVCSVLGHQARNGDAHETNLKVSPGSHMRCCRI